MKPKRTLMMVVVLATMILTSGTTQAWHWEDENPNEKFTASAGDPRVVEDAEACFEQTDELDDATCAVLYAHFWEMMNTVPMNLQRPGVCNPDPARGWTAAPQIEPFWNFNRLATFSTPSFVEYDPAACDNPRIYPKRGLASDVMVSQDADAIGYFYLSADTLEFSSLGFGTGPDAEPSLGAMPCVTVRMEFWTQRHVGEGALLGAGQTTKTVASMPAGTGDTPTPLPDPCPGADGEVLLEEITEFEVNLGPIAREIRAHEGYVVGIQLYAHDFGDPAWHQEKIMYREWNLRTSQDNPVRVLLPVEDVLHVDEPTLEPHDGLLKIQSEMRSPWGSYDVDTANIRVQVLDSDGNVVADQDSPHMGDPVLRYSTDHDGHFLPVQATFPWDYKSEDLPPGEYTVRMIATNWQHTADASNDAALQIDTEGEAHPLGAAGLMATATVPLPPVLIVLATLGGLLTAIRSRKE